MSTALYIATHKPVRFKLPSEYLWVQVNAAKNGKWEGYLHDSDGEDNISAKNPSYCELTALYLLWKASSSDIAGLCHYRRFFGRGFLNSLAEIAGVQFKTDQIGFLILKKKRIEVFLKKYEMILTRPLCPYPINVYEDLLRFVFPSDIEALVLTIEQDFPEYAKTLQRVLHSTNISYCNMFITRRETLNQYCSWLFDVLGRIEKRIDISSYDASHARVFGYLAEILLNVYVIHQGFSVKEVPVVTRDDDNTPLTLRRRITVFCYLLTIALNIAPKQWRRPLWVSRLIHYKKKDKSAKYLNTPPSKALSNYFKSAGGNDIRVVGTHPLYIQSVFGDSTIHAFCADEATDLNSLLSIIEILRSTPRPFGIGHHIRIYKCGTIAETMKQAILDHGFFLVDDTPWGYYCSIE